MANPSRDTDREAVNALGVPPTVLAEIAARRWDLHPAIAANPSASPELLAWIRGVNPAGVVPQQQGAAPQWSTSHHPGQGRAASSGIGALPVHLAPNAFPRQHARPPVPARRSSAGWWFAGCGCLAVAALVIVVLVMSFGLGAALLPSSTQGNPVQPQPQQPQPQQPQATTDSGVAAQIALFRADQARINELAAQLEGNPVAPLVADLRNFRLDEKRADDPTIGIYEAKPIAERAAALRVSLEESIAKAEARRTNASGSLTEGIVDAAGNGFIDIQWDAATACSSQAAPGRENIGCVKASDPLTVHLLPEQEVGSVWMNEMLVTHELAHVYQHADDLGADDYSGAYHDLLAQGHFQGSKEVMADCFALTVYDRWSLTNGTESQGNGYVCNEAERQVLREWAASLNVQMG
ncbi:hypothetical protein [Humidisolicoccus flavus]|uniref:variant leucine-rich repeat-containing protein n=1 Tax=Humidisolicoccus flavus TaxID=3111414 RepID=UPI00324D603D